MNKLLHKPKAVIFDMDGLILDTEVVYRTTWQQAAAEFGYDMSDEFYSCFVGRRTDECLATLLETYGSDFPISAFLARGSHLYQMHVKSYGIRAKPGLHELLDLLDALRVPKAVATSTERAHALACLGGLAGRFMTIVTGDEVTHGKPAPDIFLLAAERLRLAPRQCLVLEDSGAGVRAAHSAGMPVIMVPDLEPSSAEVAAQTACVCSSLHEVKELLMKL